MLTKHNAVFIGFLVVALFPWPARSQNPSTVAAPDPAPASRTGLDLAEKGHCKEALPILRKSASTVPDKQLKKKLGLATIRCGISLDQREAIVATILWLNREFPNDPDVLYVITHAYSDLSERTSLQLARTAPASYQAHELNAESLEMQGKWDAAIAEYRLVLEQDPQLQGIHFRVARAYLSQPETPTTTQDAQHELEEELRIDPNNAGAEYVLGELAGRGQEWEVAVQHFSRTVKLDAGFADAFLGLGSCYVSMGKFTEAIEPLEKYVKMQPGNPAGHYQLAIAYSRAGRKEEAKREAALQKETSERIEQEKQKAADALQRQAAEQDAKKPQPQN